jgi:AraC-like DNA-binding protein
VLEGTTGRQGRPVKTVNEDYLKEAMSSSRNITLAALARKLKMHRNTLHRKMKSYGISRKFDDVSDADLDALASAFKADKPNAGFRYLVGYL